MEEIKEGAADHSVMRQPGDKDMHELFVAVLLHHHIMIVPHYLVELLLYAVQRQDMELTAQRSCSSFYRHSLLCSLTCSFFVWFLCGMLFVGLPVCAQVGAFCVGRILPFACPRVIDVLFFEEAGARTAVDLLCVYLWQCIYPMSMCVCPSHESLCLSHETSAL